LILAADSIWPRGRIVHSEFLLDSQNVSGVQFIEISREDHMLLKEFLVSLKDWPRRQDMVSVKVKGAAEPGYRKKSAE
jgi:hypothetical protein